MRNSTPPPKWVFGAALFGAVLFWFFIKASQFQSNNESFNDGLLTLQLSKSWLDGRPVLFDTFYGDHTLIHNYYFILLLGPLTHITGIYGLFAAYLILLLVFFYRWRAGFKLFPDNWSQHWLAVFVFVFGPFAYYVNLDLYGWHPEHYFLPCLALTSLSLARRSFRAAAFWLILSLAIKESAAVMICSLLLFCSVADLVLKKPEQHFVSYFINKRNLIIVAGCLFMFCAGMWWLSHLNGPRESRLSDAFSRVQQKGSFLFIVKYALVYIAIGLLTFVIGIFPFIPLLKTVGKARVILTALAIGYILLFFVFVIESLYYFPAIDIAVSYPPRIGGLWAYLTSCYIFLSFRLGNSGAKTASRQMNWILAGVGLQFVLAPFLVAHRYSIIGKKQDIGLQMKQLISTDFDFSPYPGGTAKQLSDLARELPKNAEIVAPHEFISYFHQVYPAEWGEKGEKPYLLGKPLVYIYEKKQLAERKYSAYPGTGFMTLPNNQLLILVDSLWYQTTGR